MDKNRPPNVMNAGYTDLGKGKTHRHPIDYVDLSTYIKEQIEAVDLTVHELMELNIKEDRITNLHLMKLSGIEPTGDDVEWP